MKFPAIFFLGLITVLPNSPANAPLSPLDYTYGFWSGNWRRPLGKTSPDILNIESGRYGLQWNIQNPRELHFGPLKDKADYRKAGKTGLERLRDLPPAELTAELRMGDRVYQMTSCRAGLETKKETALSNIWLWESAQIAQHYEMRELRFEDAQGNPLPALASISLVAWPENPTFTLDVRPEFDYANGPAPGRQGNGYSVRTEPFELPHSPAIDSKEFTVAFSFHRDPRSRPEGIVLIGKNQNELQDGYFEISVALFGQISGTMNIGGGREGIHRVTAQLTRLDVKDEWHHAALSYDGKTMRLYVNGKLLGEKEIGLERKPGEGVLRLGRRPDDARACFQGIYDDLRIWNRALTPEEIKAVSKNSEKLPPSEDLVFEQTFDDAPPATHPVFKDAVLSLRLKTADGEWHSERTITGDWTFPQSERISLTCDLPGAPDPQEALSVQVLASGNQTVPTAFDTKFNCFLARADYSHSVPQGVRLTRPAKHDLTSFGNYDDFVIEVENSSAEQQMTPFLLDLVSPASITGLVAMICEPDGTPTGIPVQVSKNWHHEQMGYYLRAYTLLPTAPGKSSYLLRVAYGFYGTLPSASLGQLSLVGYGDSTNGRWDQWAIGTWGETFCLDPEFSGSLSPITDIRAVFTRIGKEGKQWLWSSAGWGADWLSVRDASGKKLTTARMKASYLSHGPCLPEIVYHGSYGTNGEVALTAEASTPRTDDHSKVFLRLRYDFRAELSAKDAWFFRLGYGKVFCPKIAFGNREGLIRELDAPVGVKVGDCVLDREVFSGAAPWWLGFPGSKVPKFPSGSRGLVIRSYRANLGGKTFDTPSLTLLVGETGKFARTEKGYESNPGGSETLGHVDAAIVPPLEIEKFQPGDSVELELELDVVPVEADDYYGPNEEFRKHLAENPASWKTFYRAAVGNDLQVAVQGGTLLRKFPIIIQADPDAPAVHLQIQGGAGAVPVRFQGLASPTGYQLGRQLEAESLPLDQAATGNDFWETSFDPATQTYTRTYNLPLDGAGTTTWVLERIK
jgi:hypothetical protein